MARRPGPLRKLTAEQATAELAEVLDEIGFAPQPVRTGRKRQVLLHHCPFREAAEEHREVVCSVHLGLMQGLLEELGAPVQAERLDPFVEPSLCVTHLAPRVR
jgi:predicted ArsR family transcriptional regulator